MNVRVRLENAIKAQIAEFVASADFEDLRSGSYSREAYDTFISRVVRAHIRSPKLLGFLFAMAPPGEATEDLQHNLLEELGLDESDNVPHPDLLKNLLDAAELTQFLQRLTREADNDLRRYTTDPLLYGTLKEIGFAVLVEIVAFEYMLSRCASLIANALRDHRGLAEAGLVWFTHHSEVDIAHAEQGLDSVELYAQWYEISDRETQAIIEMTFRENVFVKRYFGVHSLAKVRGLG